MPKVSEQYITEKKNQIMDATFEVIKGIPLYEITMRDIIKKVGCSQGMIYRYYNNIDEIFVDLMNREVRDIEFVTILSEIFHSEKNSADIIKGAFALLGNYIMQVQERVGGKFYYEIQVLYMFDVDKKEKILSQLILRKNMDYFQEKMLSFIMKNIREKKFIPIISIDELVLYTRVMVDGIGNQMAVKKDEHSYQMFDMLSAYIIDSLGIRKD